MKGLTGILRPNGEFLECDYSNHGLIAQDIPVEEEMECIYFSGSDDGESSVLYFNKSITNQQLEWFMKNIYDLDKSQYNLWMSFIQGKIKGE